MKEKKTETRFVGIDLGKRIYEMEILRKGTAGAVFGKVTRNNGRTSVEGRQKLYK